MVILCLVLSKTGYFLVNLEDANNVRGLNMFVLSCQGYFSDVMYIRGCNWLHLHFSFCPLVRGKPGHPLVAVTLWVSVYVIVLLLYGLCSSWGVWCSRRSRSGTPPHLSLSKENWVNGQPAGLDGKSDHRDSNLRLLACLCRISHPPPPVQQE